MNPEQVVALAVDADPSDPARSVLIAAAVASAIGGQVVLVGGAAVNLHTGVYRPTDIDLIARLGPEQHLALERLGFRRRGRHYQLDAPDGPILIEFPDDHLHPLLTSEPEAIEVAPGVRALVIALDDLMMDRTLQATDGTAVTFDEALRLAVAAYARINWDSLRRRCDAAFDEVGTLAATRLAGTLDRIRRVAKRRIREGKNTTH